MTVPPRLWIAAAHHPASGSGGWAVLRLVDGQTSGQAGGERRTTPLRMALAALAAALRDIPGPVKVESASPEAEVIGAVLAGRSPGPEDDLDRWAPVLAATKGRSLELVRVTAAPDSPAAFVDAWAAFGLTKAKTSGPFTAAIPRPNLAKVAQGFR